METVDLNEINSYRTGRVVKDVLLSGKERMATVLLIDRQSELEQEQANEYPEMHYVLEGEGTITLDHGKDNGREAGRVNQGHLVLIPGGSYYSYSTDSSRLKILAVMKPPLVDDDLGSMKEENEISGGDKNE